MIKRRKNDRRGRRNEEREAMRTRGSIRENMMSPMRPNEKWEEGEKQEVEKDNEGKEKDQQEKERRRSVAEYSPVDIWRRHVCPA